MEETTTEAIVEKRSKKPLLVAGILLGAVLAVYLGFCIAAANTDTFYPNSFFNGVDISGQTPAQASETVRRDLTAGSLALFLDEADETPDATLSYVNLGLRPQT
ncbi:MAG: hypothetical protein RR350_09730, partial [Oscillibacter sp.]